MALIAVCSAKGSPGATVTALAFTLSWTRSVILAECDPAGGDIAAGYLRDVPIGERGLAQLTASLYRHRLVQDLWGQLFDLAPGRDAAMTRLVLPGLSEPTQAAGVALGWEQIANAFRGLEASGFDIVADCGRLMTTYPPKPILAAADTVLLVLRLTLPSIRSAATALAALRSEGIDRVGLVTVGDGPYAAKEVALHLRTWVVAALPADRRTAAVLSNGGQHGTQRHRGRLLRAAALAERDVYRMVTAGQAARDAQSLQPGPPTSVRQVASVH